MHSSKAPKKTLPINSDKVSLDKTKGDNTWQLADQRPEATAQRKLQEMASASPQAIKTTQLQSKVTRHLAEQSQPIQKKENNTGLPDNLKSGIENLSGHAMDDVKVHYNSDKPAQLNAHAYAQGSNIHLASGQEKHLPHEAWHVVQQKQGRVKPTMQMKGKVNINDDAGLEQEADVMGAKALNTAVQLSLKSTIPNANNSNEVSEQTVLQQKKINEYAIQLRGNDTEVAQLQGKALEELKGHLKNIPKYMGEAIYRWIPLIGASAILLYLKGGGSFLSQAAIFLMPTTGWLGLGAIKMIYDRLPYSGGGLKIGLGPLIEDTFHLATYSFPWSAGSYHTITADTHTIADGNYIFILDMKNNFRYITSEDREIEGAHLYIRHSQLAGGGKVKTAGRLIVQDGVCKLTNESGHYWPDPSSISIAKAFLATTDIHHEIQEEAFEPPKEK